MEDEDEYEECSDDTSSCSGRYNQEDNVPIIDSDLYFAIKRAMGLYMYSDGKSLM